MRKILSSLSGLLAVGLMACGSTPSRPPAAAVPSLPAPVEITRDTSPPATADEMADLCERATVRATHLLEQVRGDAPRTVDGTLRPVNALVAELDTAGGWASLLYNVHPDEALREAARVCQERVGKFFNDLSLDRGVYEAVAAVDVAGADPLTRRFSERLLRDFRRAGVDKDEATRARLAAMYEEMVRLMQTFGQTVREDVRSIEVEPADLEGLPADFVAAHPVNAEGKVVLTTDYPDFYPFQTYSPREDLRRDLYIAFLSRGYPANKPVLERLLKLRAEYAHTLGYADWAAYQAEDKMVRSAETVESFIGEIAEIARPRAEADLKMLLARKRQDDPKAETVQFWDRFHYVSKVRADSYDFDARSIRPYFSYPRVKQGILDLYAELFDLEFVRLEDAAVWHPQVEAYLLKSEGREIARFFLDMQPRPGKYKHAAMFSLQTGLETGRLPVASLVCNFADPTVGDGTALMEHSEVKTFFHEFGHLIHHLLARRGEWVTLAGIQTERDFVEVPSQLLEEWSWDAGILARFATHVETGEPIPAELVERLKGADAFGKGVDVMRQILFAAYSFHLHREAPATLDLEAFTDRIHEGYSPYPRPENATIYTNFGHLMGYDSQYYTYQWSLSIAKDFASRFKEAGLMDPATAAHYRRAVLEAGGTQDARELAEEFLGRAYGLDAYRDWLQN